MKTVCMIKIKKAFEEYQKFVAKNRPVLLKNKKAGEYIDNTNVFLLDSILEKFEVKNEK